MEEEIVLVELSDVDDTDKLTANGPQGQIELINRFYKKKPGKLTIRTHTRVFSIVNDGKSDSLVLQTEIPSNPQ